MNTNLKEITNFLAINENLGTAGMPQESQLEEIANAGYQVVINLALSESPGAINNEAQILSSYGIRYFHIPVVWEKPDLASLKNFLQTMDECATQKVLVHCVLNMRVSIFIYLYRLLRLAVSPENAFESVQEIWDPNNTWQLFIHKALLAHAEGKI